MNLDMLYLLLSANASSCGQQYMTEFNLFYTFVICFNKNHRSTLSVRWVTQCVELAGCED